MIKALTLVVGLLLTTQTLACDLRGVGDLPESVQQELKITCEQAKLKVKTELEQADKGIISLVQETADGTITKENISAIGSIAKDIAMAIGIAAREVGVSVNEFLSTPAGTLTAGIILYKVMGEEMLSFINGIVMVIIAFWMSFKAANKVRYASQEDKVVKNWLGNEVNRKSITYLSWNDMEDSGAFVTLLFSILPFIVLVIVAV